jgi:trans-aconitate 2-methyltransferase
MSADWDPEQYSRFSAARTRSARELITRIPELNARMIIDLGCGDGAVTRLLGARWPNATVIGVDSSPAMLEKARQACPAAEFIDADIARWRPHDPADLIFSNAALHWLDDHQWLMPELFGHVASGGAFAVQMPANFDAPSHKLLAALASSPEWRDNLGHLLRPDPVASLSRYLEWLRPTSTAIDAWETTDMLMLDGENAVLHWMKGTALRPFLARLSAADALDFESSLAAQLADAYPRRSDGLTLFPFTRRYFAAVRGNA